MNRSIIVIFSFFAVVFSLVSAEPIRYYRQPIRASARQTNNGLAFEAELDGTSTTAAPDQNEDAERSEQTTENAPYKLAGWRPSGQLLVLPFEVRANQNLESTTTVESVTFDDEQTSTENPTTEEPTKGEQLQLETSEPKGKSAAYRRPPLKVSGALTAEVSDDSSESNEATSTTTESDDETETTSAVTGALETTSEPNSEAVDVEKTESEKNPAPNQPPQLPQGPFQPAFFVQLPDGSYQRIVYFPAQTPPVQQTVATAANVQFQQQQLVQPQVTPFGYNPISNPRIVTFSSQYQAF